MQPTDNSPNALIQVSVQCAPYGSWALARSGIALVRHCVFSNGAATPLQDVTLSFAATPALFGPRQCRIAHMGEASTLRLSPLPLVYDQTLLATLTAPTQATVQVVVRHQEQEIAQHSATLALLPHNAWGGLSLCPESLAAFVRPDDSVVDAAVRTANVPQGASAAAVLESLWAAVSAWGVEVTAMPVAYTDSAQLVDSPCLVRERGRASALEMAVLLAACVEKAGGKPVLLLNASECFVGVWDESEQGTHSFSDDKALWQQHAAHGRLTLCAVSQKEALVGGQAAAMTLQDLLGVVDVERARAQGIAPLPPAEAATTAQHRAAAQTPEPASDDAAKMERWQRNLLDLSLRNSLLNFRPGKRFIPVALPDAAPEAAARYAAELENVLADGAVLTVSAGGDDAPESASAAKDIPAVNPTATELLGKKRLLTSLHKKELDSTQLTLFRAARSALDEGGANILYLALGFLSWREKGRPNPCKAPLLLVPMRLERRNVQAGFSLSMYDEEARFNLTLLELLRREHGITSLDALAEALPADDHGVDVATVWQRVREAVARVEGWEVLPLCGLGLFSFAKYLMWKDLHQQAQIEQRNPVIRQLLHPESLSGGVTPFFAAQDLDDKLPPDKTYCPMLADSSQLAAIATAAQGQSFVLSGPPGTGKSQTITNMIAHCLGTGKSVLFVAEKAAALNVVHRRLKKCGLDPYCLQLHSSKMKKLEVLSQLHDAVRVESDFSQSRWAQETGRLQELRTRLNGYVRALHKVYPNGLTVFDALGTVLRKPDVPRVDLRWPNAGYHNEQAYADLLEAARKLEIYLADAASLRDTPVARVAQRDFSPMWSHDLMAAAAQTRELATKMQESTRQLLEVLPHSQPLCVNGNLGALADFAALLPTAQGRDWSFMARGDGFGLLVSLQNGMELLRTVRTALKELSAPCVTTDLPARLTAVDMDAVQAAWQESKSAWWPKSSVLRGKAEKTLQPLYAAGATPDLDADMPRWQKLRQNLLEITKLQNLTASTAGLWAGLDTDDTAADSAVALGTALRQCLAALGTDMAAVQAFLRDVEQLLGAGNAALMADGPVCRLLTVWQSVWREYAAQYAAFMQALGDGKACAAMNLDDTAAFCQGLCGQEQALPTWCAWLRARTEAEAQGLHNLVSAALDGTIAPQGVADALEVNYARWWVLHTVENIPELKTFAAREHESSIEDFRALDESIRLLTSQCVRAHMPERSSLITDAPGEWAILKKQMTLKKRHMPLRQLLSSLPTLLRRLTPCFLMSPLSVAQYLEAGQHMFDVVIFDEASQIPVWDALGAIAHGRNVIVVGDQKQLPPTNFFQRADDADGDDTNSDVDLESILDQCVTSNLPCIPLRWHYRSRNESLITFSNQQYYDGGLVTFPAPTMQDGGVQWHYIGGVYERGTTRTNPKEAEALVQHVVQTLRAQVGRKNPQTVGVVTFNMQQQTLIDDMLEAERRKDPSIEPFFNMDAEEPVIVKNLENIQGDERDIMYFSIGFGPDDSGQMTMNFGAINKDGGERRLNVAITRARVALHVFASIHAEQISLAKTAARGVSDLRLFLDYAERGTVALSGIKRYDEGEFASRFEETVAKRLAERGWRVRAQVGVSVFRIDLGVVDPDDPETYLAGIECDGATYKRSAAARDRERLRASVLEGLGWHMLRVWSMEWWLQPDGALERLDKALRTLQTQRRTAREAAAAKATAEAAVTPDAVPQSSGIEQSAPTPQPEAAPTPQPASAQQPVSMPAAADTAQTTAAPAATAAGTPPAEKRTDSQKIQELVPEMREACAKVEHEQQAKVLADIIALEYPVHEDRLCHLYAAQQGISRVSAKVRAQVAELVAVYPHTEEEVGTFYWPQSVDPRTVKNFPLRRVEERDVDQISMRELRALARSIVDDGLEEPVAKLGHLLGFERVRGASRERLENAWKTRNR